MTMDWAELNPDILPLIAKKLGDISNFVRFRAVCKKWRSSVRLSDQPPQLPWFLQLAASYTLESSNIEAYSLCSQRTRTLYIPGAKGARLPGSSSQYLLLLQVNDSSSSSSFSLSLFNPLTRSQIPLPGQYMPLRIIYIGPSRKHNPNASPTSLDVVLYAYEILPDGTWTEHMCVFMSRRDDRSQWNTIKVPCSCVHCYCEGRLFIHGYDTVGIRVVDVTTGDLVSVISTPSEHGDFRLIESFGDLLAVEKLFEPNEIIPLEDCRFKVYRLKHEGKKSSWVKMSRGVGDPMLFLDTLGSFSLQANDYDGIKGNCIYFSKWNGKSQSDARYAICRYDVEADKTEVVIGWREQVGTWFVPSLY